MLVKMHISATLRRSYTRAKNMFASFVRFTFSCTSAPPAPQYFFITLPLPISHLLPTNLPFPR